MILVHSHVVECPLDQVLDLLYAWASLGSIAVFYSDHLALHLYLDLELFP